MNDNQDEKNGQKKKNNTSGCLSCLVTLIVLLLIAGFIISLITHVYWLTVIIAGCFLLSLDSILFIEEFEKNASEILCFRLLFAVPVYVLSYVE